MSYTLRYYQSNAVDSVHFAWAAGIRSALLRLGTGGGKTAIAAEVVREYAEQGDRILYIADQDELCEQPKGAFYHHAGIIAGVDKGREYAPLGAQVVIASAQTISQQGRLERFPEDHFQRIIIDECHRGAERDQRVRNRFPSAYSLGNTATPFRMDMATLEKFYEEKVFDMPMQDLEREGFAPKVVVEAFPIEIDLQGLSEKIRGEKYDDDALDTTIAPYFHAIAQELQRSYKDRHLVVFLPLIRSSKAFAKICNEYEGLHAAHVDKDGGDIEGRQYTRQQIYDSVKDGTINVLCNAGVVSTGVDIPILDTFLNLRLVRSRAWYQQAFGRCCRVLPGVVDDIPGPDQADERRARIAASAKPYTLALDLLLQHDSLGSMHPGHLFADSVEEADAIVAATRKQRGAHEILAIQKEVQRQKEAALVEALDSRQAKVYSGRLVDSRVVPLMIGRADIASYRPPAHLLGQPTEKQGIMLREYGVDPVTVTSKGLAHLLIGALIDRRRRGLATVGQLNRLVEAGPDWLLRHGIQRPDLIRKTDANQLVAFRFEELKTRRPERTVFMHAY